MNSLSNEIYLEDKNLHIRRNNILYKVDVRKASKRLAKANLKDIKKFDYDEYGIHWDKLNEDLSIEGLIKDSIANLNYEKINGYDVKEFKRYEFKITPQKITENINLYLNGYSDFNGRTEFDRLTSFDYCYNYFNSFKNKLEIIDEENIEKSSLQLGFYLASWGMFRSSGKLITKSSKYYQNILKFIVESGNDLWEIDVDKYSLENKNKIIDFIKKFKTNFKDLKPTDTLISKIMLGVFGNIPAFDDNFKKGFGVGKINIKNLEKVKLFYDANKFDLDAFHNEISTLSFNNKGKKFNYPISKIIDMIGFIEGLKIKNK
ncbi:MAG: DUF2442 domain-containing protein [Ignavibacteria bacterium]|nr:DUF2442 domain-containing protein [Ignavibacteria bacterium]